MDAFECDTFATSDSIDRLLAACKVSIAGAVDLVVVDVVVGFFRGGCCGSGGV